MCVCLNAFMLLSSYLKLLSVIGLLKASGHSIEVKTIDNIFIRKSEGWPWLLNKGFIYNNILAIFSGLLTTGRLQGGDCLMGGR